MIIPMVPVSSSSSIAAVGHDRQTNTLAVQFHGSPPRTYHFSGVSSAEHAALSAAPSVGKHFTAHIKPKYAGRLA